MNEGSDNADDVRMAKILRELSEHYNHVQIFVMRDDEDDEAGATMHYVSGRGNWFARIGLIRTWLMRMDEQEKFFQRRKLEAEED